MRLDDLALLAAVQIPNACLAGAGVYLASKLRTRGAVLVAVCLTLTLVLSVAGNFIPNETRTVFNESGQIAGAMVEGGDLHILLGYVGSGLRILLALGLVLLALEWRRARSMAVSPNKSLERSHEE